MSGTLLGYILIDSTVSKTKSSSHEAFILRRQPLNICHAVIRIIKKSKQNRKTQSGVMKRDRVQFYIVSGKSHSDKVIQEQRHEWKEKVSWVDCWMKSYQTEGVWKRKGSGTTTYLVCSRNPKCS